MPVLLLAPAPLPSLAQDSGEAPAGTPDVYVNTELLERLAKERPAPAPTGAQQPRALLQAPPTWQLESRLYVVPLGQAGPAEPALAPPAPSVLTSELEALEGRRPGSGRNEAVVKPRAVPPRPETAEATPSPDEEAAPGASAPEESEPEESELEETEPEETEEPDAATAPLPAAGPGDSAPPAAAAAAEPPDPAPSAGEAAAEAPGAPPAPAAILDELAKRETPRPGKITAPPVPEPPAPPGKATAAADTPATAEETAPATPPPAAPPAPGPEERLGPAAPAVAAPGDGKPQLTARPPAKAPLEGQILFETGSTELSPEARSVLESLAARLLAADAEAIELRAYATGRDPRRLSLSRGLVARSYLEKLGVAADKVFLRPLGDKAADGPSERIDYELVTP